MARDKRKSNGHITRAPKKYGSYMFRTKDPVIDELRTEIQQKYGRITHKTLRKIEDGGGPSVGAMVGWFHGDTLRPSNAGVEATGRSMGRKRVWVDDRPNR